MDWIRQDKYHFESGNKQYRIAITYSREQCIYTAWRRENLHGETVWLPILYTRDLSMAQQACEEDSNAR